ncbi:hypothetical protein V7S43_019105 [Phytophthora oleae]
MVWEAFGYKGKSELAVLEGRQNSGHYIYTVSEHLLPFDYKNYGTDLVFMQDNASIHASYETTSFFEDIGMQLLDWPARSPDLNPIENVWAILARKVYSHDKQYNFIPDLTAAIMEVWESVTMAELHVLMDSMPARCFKVACAGGDTISY